MKKWFNFGSCLAAAGLMAGTVAWGAGVATTGFPLAGGGGFLTLPLTGNEQGLFDTLLPNGQNPQSEAISLNQIASFVGATGKVNVLIGGDATTNLFQRATAGASVTTAITYGGPDRWAYWSGVNTAMTVSQDLTAVDIPVGFKAAFKMARTAAQTGLVQMCMAQEVEGVNAYQFQSAVAELSFNVVTGANFSSLNSNMNAFIVTGTGADEGVTKLAFGLNGGGGGASAWTGQANATVGLISLGGVSTAGRYGVVASIPATATEMAVVLCYTPTGTAGANDYIAFSGIQLIRNTSLSSFVSASVGYSGAVVPFTTFDRRSMAVETELQQRYAYSINEGTITAGSAMASAGMAPTATTCLTSLPFPVPMRSAPTFTNALTASTFKLNSAAVNVALSAPFAATTGANNVTGASITFTATTLAATPGFACILVSAAGSGQMLFSSEF